MVKHQNEDSRKPAGKEKKMQQRRQRKNNKMRERYYEEPVDKTVKREKTTEKVCRSAARASLLTPVLPLDFPILLILFQLK